MVNIFYTAFDCQLPIKEFDYYIGKLPQNLRDKNTKYFRWQNRYSHLFGKLLLLEALKDFGYDSSILSQINTNSYNRPFIDFDEIDFNISHSGKYVLCAVAKKVRLGVDIEEIRPIDLSYYKKTMNSLQWNIIENDPNPTRAFFRFWAQKESVIKADGKGMAIPLRLLEEKNNMIKCNDKSWYVKELNLNEEYCAAIATSCLSDVKLHFINFY